jgi:CRP-like cAMP-binding protein
MAAIDHVRSASLPASAPRRLRIDDHVRLDGVPEGANSLDIWYPLISDDPYQQVLDVSIDVGCPLDLGHDPEHGNRIGHLRLQRPLPAGLDFHVSYLVARAGPPTATAVLCSGRPPRDPLMLRDLEVDLPASEAADLRRLAVQAAAGAPDPVRLAARLGDGAARADAAERFVNLCRMAGIPARVVAGLRVSGSGRMSSHLWAELFLADRGWVGTDPLCSLDGGGAELCPPGLGHVSRTRGSSLLLQPVQRGPRLRVFAGPYAEVDGRPHPVRDDVRVRREPADGAGLPEPAGAGVPDPGTVLAEELAELEPAPPRFRLARAALLPPVRSEDWLYVLTRGRVRLSRLTVSGRRLELAVLGAPAFFHADRVRRGVAEALEDSEVRALSREQVLWVARRRPDFGFRLLETFGQRLVESEDRLEYLAYHGVSARLALALLRRRRHDGVVDETTHQQLGDVVGASRETVTKVLGQLQAEGRIRVRHRRIDVLDPDGLARLLER